MFPCYRRYPNGKSYFKISSPSHVLEIQLLGSRYSLFEMEAKILPDRNFVSDLIQNAGGHWEEITEAEFEAFYLDCQLKRQAF